MAHNEASIERHPRRHGSSAGRDVSGRKVIGVSREDISVRRTVLKGRRRDGTIGEVIRLEPENDEDMEEIRRLERAGLLSTDENMGDVVATRLEKAKRGRRWNSR